MRKFFRRRNLILGSTLLLLLAFEWYWIKMAFEKEVNRIHIESSHLIKSATRQKEMLVFERMIENNLKMGAIEPINLPKTLLAPGPLPSLDSIIIGVREIIRSDSLLEMDTMPLPLIFNRISNSIKSQKGLEKKIQSVMMIRETPYEEPGDEDSLRIWIAKSHSEAQLPDKYEIVSLKMQPFAEKKDYKSYTGILSRPAKTKFSRKFYRLHFPEFKSFVFRSIWPEIALSLMVLLAICISFAILIRSQKKAERLAVMKGEFISNMTHNLKTPIATVSVALEALKSFGVADNPAKRSEYLDISANELKRLALMVDQTLQISALTSQKMALILEPQPLIPIVEEAVSLMKPVCEKYGIQTDIEFAFPDIKVAVERSHMVSVLVNLLENSIKYRRRNPRIAIQVTHRNGMVLLRVEDNGIGIPKADLKQIFDNFFRSPTLAQHPSTGSGIGLAFVKSVLQNMNGDIAVESEEGVGTTMIIKLPHV